jgi:hypothetical protein
MQMPSPAAGAGLGAMIQAKGTAGAGAPKKTMNEMMALADKLPDSELADVLSGKSVRVPQFAAMLAAMGRESLRKAVAGAQAGQAKEPSKKDQMLARMQPQAQPPMPPQAVAGLASLPAPNMETVSAAEGGIIGFSGEVDSFVEEREDRRTPFDIMLGNRYRPPRNQPVTPDPTNRNIDMVTGAISTGAIPYADAKLDNQINIDNQMSAAPSETGAAPSGAAPAGTTPRAPGGGAPFAAAPERRKSFLDGLEDNSEDVAKRIAQGKSQAQGEFLLQLGASLMGTQNLGRALQQGIQTGLPGIVANRKEANALVKEQRDYRLNMAKAKEAAAQGNDDLTFKYAKLAEDSKYQAGMVGAAMARGGNLTAKQFEAARKAADTALDNELKRLGPRARLMTPEQRDAFRTEAYNRTLQTIQSGVMPQAPGPQFQEPPSGAVTRE